MDSPGNNALMISVKGYVNLVNKNFKKLTAEHMLLGGV